MKAPARPRAATASKTPSTGQAASIGPGKAAPKAKRAAAPAGLEEVEPEYTRELIRKGRARVYEIPPPIVGRGNRVRESDIEDTEIEQERARLALVDEWQDIPPDVTPEDIESYRQDWVEEFPEFAEGEDPEAYAALDDAFMANWGLEWLSRPWSMEGVPEEAITREQAKIAPLRTKAQEVEEAYEMYVENAMLEAIKATRTAIFSKEGKRLGISDIALFKGRLTRKYASEELLEWWETNPRLTRTEFVRQWGKNREDRARGVRGRGGSRRAAPRPARGGSQVVVAQDGQVGYGLSSAGGSTPA